MGITSARRDECVALVRRDPLCYQDFPETERSDYKLAVVALQCNLENYRYMSSNLKQDGAFIQMAPAQAASCGVKTTFPFVDFALRKGRLTHSG